jgi:hypothetical protein
VFFFGVANLCSAIVEGQYTAPGASLGISITLLVLLNGSRLRIFNPFFCMIGADQTDRETGLLQGPLPWFSLVAFSIAAALLVAVGIFRTRTRDF